MSNVVSADFTNDSEVLEASEARTLHDASAQDEIRRAYSRENVVKAGQAFGRAQARKALRVNFQGMDSTEIVNHCLDLS